MSGKHPCSFSLLSFPLTASSPSALVSFLASCHWHAIDCPSFLLKITLLSAAQLFSRWSFFDSPFRTTRLCTGMQWFVLSPSPSLFLPKWLSLHSHLTKILSYMYVLISDGKLVQITLKSIINRITGVLGTPC
jgi:hypothetical protein